MSKTSEAAGGSDRMFDRRLYFCTAVLAALVVLVGFARTFYLRIWFDVPPLSALRYLHGLLMTIWYAPESTGGRVLLDGDFIHIQSSSTRPSLVEFLCNLTRNSKRLSIGLRAIIGHR